LISKYSIGKGFLQDTRALSAINSNHRIKDFSVCTGLGATFIINEENRVFCENTIKTGCISKVHTNPPEKKEPFSLAARCQLLNQH